MSAGGRPYGICRGLGCPWLGRVPWQVPQTQSPQAEVIHLPRQRRQPWEETDHALVAPRLTKWSLREWINLLPRIATGPCSGGAALALPFPSLGLRVSPQFATGLGRRVPGHLPAGPSARGQGGTCHPAPPCGCLVGLV